MSITGNALGMLPFCQNALTYVERWHAGRHPLVRHMSHKPEVYPMSRIQLALNVDDLDAAIAFYSTLFGAER